jgi:CRP-like cAMP-binding protein
MRIFQNEVLMSGNEKSNNSPLPFRAGDALWGNIFKKDRSQEESIIAVLRQVPLFNGIKKSGLNELVKLIHVRKYKADEAVFWEGEPGVGMYIMLDGVVAIFKETAKKQHEELAQLKRGEFFGELALLDESPRSASAIAQEDSKILGLFRPELIDLIEKKPRLGNTLLFNLAALIGERLKRTNDELQALWNKLEDSKVIT